jgi:hypothetical protein
MTILLVLRNEIGATTTATDGWITVHSESAPTVFYAEQFNIAAASPSTPTVTSETIQTISSVSVSIPMVTFELS